MVRTDTLQPPIHSWFLPGQVGSNRLPGSNAKQAAFCRNATHVSDTPHDIGPSSHRYTSLEQHGVCILATVSTVVGNMELAQCAAAEARQCHAASNPHSMLDDLSLHVVIYITSLLRR